MAQNNYAYPTIVAWHKSSMKYYIDNLVRAAQAMDAPRNAVYCERNTDGKITRWVTTDDVKDFDTGEDGTEMRLALNDLADELWKLYQNANKPKEA